MGRRSQELMTGCSYEERVSRAKTSGIVKRIAQLMRINKDPPKYYPNYKRNGILKLRDI